MLKDLSTVLQVVFLAKVGNAHCSAGFIYGSMKSALSTAY